MNRLVHTHTHTHTHTHIYIYIYIRKKDVRLFGNLIRQVHHTPAIESYSFFFFLTFLLFSQNLKPKKVFLGSFLLPLFFFILLNDVSSWLCLLRWHAHNHFKQADSINNQRVKHTNITCPNPVSNLVLIFLLSTQHRLLIFLHFIYIHTHIYIYIYIYMCVCVCVCVYLSKSRDLMECMNNYYLCEFLTLWRRNKKYHSVWIPQL